MTDRFLVDSEVNHSRTILRQSSPTSKTPEGTYWMRMVFACGDGVSEGQFSTTLTGYRRTVPMNPFTRHQFKDRNVYSPPRRTGVDILEMARDTLRFGRGASSCVSPTHEAFNCTSKHFEIVPVLTEGRLAVYFSTCVLTMHAILHQL